MQKNGHVKFSRETAGFDKSSLSRVSFSLGAMEALFLSRLLQARRIQRLSLTLHCKRVQIKLAYVCGVT
jgi:hypothetical protein